MDQQVYDSLLDALDHSNIELLQELFLQYNLTPLSELFDAPRITGIIGISDITLNTYIDYVIYHNLIDILDYLIDNSLLIIDDNIMCRALTLNQETFDYIIDLKYIPGEKTLKYAVCNCISNQVDKILALDNELITIIDMNDLEYLFSFDIDEETVETIRVLFNYNIDKNLFNVFLEAFKNPNDTYFSITEEEQDAAIEIIDFLEENM